MRMLERAGLAVMHRMEPETAHDWAIWALERGLVPLPAKMRSPRLKTRLGRLELENPLGLAAGFDKNARALPALMQAGFGFVEVGATTPRPQPGNPRPRLFRLPEDRAVINRFGFNNEGEEAMEARLKGRPRGGVLGLNLGANKDSQDRIPDYVSVLQTCGRHVDFVTINVSSPNTEQLRDLQGKKALWALVSEVMQARAELPLDARPLVFLKIAPDLKAQSLADIAEVATVSSLDGVIATNTTIGREGLGSRHRGETGGLSGAPLFTRSTAVLAQLHELTGGKLPLIGVGGIASAEDAFAKITAGADALQIYSALVYEGLSLVPRILEGLDRKLKEAGLGSVAEARGQEAHLWARRFED
ncbi:quinone-dependent dihydroorotate dehydrogenase [Mangrovicoccus algicola]|uniref:Dihydroorotate dehydrogenase (quinone) n=1 Tax=Mangrovicoccus algicola TaxID=2771008 RepID=A0A8J6YX14_9RHOB|nr:quinone-dependent dihydroorotate dehydrogenase [Mangrovicoccus algicola]MBE3639445.1 quinone-dependent dihydroorotate dehydrogenase [Mangrovicoccus algicola]